MSTDAYAAVQAALEAAEANQETEQAARELTLAQAFIRREGHSRFIARSNGTGVEVPATGRFIGEEPATTGKAAIRTS